jgi:hypothetical protein
MVDSTLQERLELKERIQEQLAVIRQATRPDETPNYNNGFNPYMTDAVKRILTPGRVPMMGISIPLDDILKLFGVR